MDFPKDLKYVDSHEYLRVEGDQVTIGITAYAVDQLGDIVFVQLPEEGSELKKGESFGSVESVKAVEDLYAPLTGRIVAVNTAVMDDPATLGDDPYENGWLLKVTLTDASELDDTLTVEEYCEQIGV
ncbi:glycine cleavage system protein GcvH [Candidatus Cyanaurora vandensis]|uniref:glycine cleavage system protein GcvH n=1 Tax=Candidatus Cyanaurora vandensis TaxID=2714958 RepID=UPI00257EABDF|nr:glycine cleavage system protein GcvH [Candidatus Cyanaurora vandensis]